MINERPFLSESCVGVYIEKNHSVKLLDHLYANAACKVAQWQPGQQPWPGIHANYLKEKQR